MPNLLPDQWKETLERVQDKAVHFLEKFKKSKNTDSDRERINEDFLPSFIQCGGPPLDMHESAGELIVTVEVPGLKKDDIQVELVGRRLVIRGEKKASHEQKRSRRPMCARWLDALHPSHRHVGLARAHQRLVLAALQNRGTRQPHCGDSWCIGRLATGLSGPD